MALTTDLRTKTKTEPLFISPIDQTPFSKVVPSGIVSITKPTRPFGKASLTRTLVALSGPLFLTVIVQNTTVPL